MCHRTELLALLARDVATFDEGIAAERCNHLKRSLIKKWEPLEGDTSANDAALAKFKLCNERCRDYSVTPDHDFLGQVLGEVTYFFDKIFIESNQDSTINLTSISRGFGLGPGASVGSDDNSFYTKLFSSPLTHTNVALPRLFEVAIDSIPRCKQAEVVRSAHFGSRLVEASSLSFVPKTLDESRTICTEPVLNMVFQKGIGDVLTRLLKRYFRIDLTKQPEINRQLAQIGSMSGTFGTIDLSSASDTISLNLLRKILPRYVLRWLEIARSPYTKLPSGELIELYMVSSMGNGFTFPLQTLIFSALVRAVYRLRNKKLRLSNGKRLPNFGVFGDDIIVDREVYDDVVAALHHFGFTVNKDKSFNTGTFRESCGGDYIEGHDVRGVYIRRLQTYQDAYSAFNRLTRWVDKTGVPLNATLQYLYDLVPAALKLPVPYFCNDTEGFKVSSSLASLIHTANRELARRTATKQLLPFWKQKVLRQVAVIRPRTVTVKLRSNSTHDWNGHPINWDGWILSIIGGYVRNGAISLRVDKPIPSVRFLSCRCWYDRASPDPEDILKSTHPLKKGEWISEGRDYIWEYIVDLRLTAVEP